MLLNLNKFCFPMKSVYSLSKRLNNNPEEISEIQALTLNSSRPLFGLKGKYGLYGSPEWWKNIEQKEMPLIFISGVISRLYFAGQDEPDGLNSFELILEDGSTHDESIYVNDGNDSSLFRVGCQIEIVYALDELKKQPALDGSINYSEIPLEIAVSLEPIILPV